MPPRKVFVFDEKLARKTADDIGKNRLERKKNRVQTPEAPLTPRVAIVRPIETITAYNSTTDQMGIGKVVFLDVNANDNTLEEYRDSWNDRREATVYNPYPFRFKSPYPRCLYVMLDTVGRWVISGYTEIPVVCGELYEDYTAEADSFADVEVVSPTLDKDFYQTGMGDVPSRDSSSSWTTRHVGAKPNYSIREGTRFRAGQRVHLQYDMYHECWFFFVTAGGGESALIDVDDVPIGFIRGVDSRPAFVSNNVSLYRITGKYTGEIVDVPFAFGASWYDGFCIVNGVYVHIPIHINYISRITHLDSSPSTGSGTIWSGNINNLLEYDLDFSGEDLQGKSAECAYLKYYKQDTNNGGFAWVGNDALSPYQVYGNVLSNYFSGVFKTTLDGEEKWIRANYTSFTELNDQTEVHNFELPDGVEPAQNSRVSYQLISGYRCQTNSSNAYNNGYETFRLLLTLESFNYPSVSSGIRARDNMSITGKPYIDFLFTKTYNDEALRFRGTPRLNNYDESDGAFISINDNQYKYGWYELKAVPELTTDNAVFEYKHYLLNYAFNLLNFLQADGNLGQCHPRYDTQVDFLFVVQKIEDKYAVVVNCLYWLDLSSLLSIEVPYIGEGGDIIDVPMQDIFDLIINGQTVQEIVQNGMTYRPQWSQIGYNTDIELTLRDNVTMDDIVAEPVIGDYPDLEHYCYNYDSYGIRQDMAQSIPAYAIELPVFIQEEDEEEGE